jgi:Phytanoyl-CoA dioxygenase (PhyH)
VNYRSKHRALLLLCLLSDVGPDDAPTRISPGSHLQMPRLLQPGGDRGLPGAAAGQNSEIPLPDLDQDAILAVGEAGDVFICHPFLVHAAGWPHRGREPRFVSQPPISIPGSPNRGTDRRVVAGGGRYSPGAQPQCPRWLTSTGRPSGSSTTTRQAHGIVSCPETMGVARSLSLAVTSSRDST